MNKRLIVSLAVFAVAGCSDNAHDPDAGQRDLDAGADQSLSDSGQLTDDADSRTDDTGSNDVGDGDARSDDADASTADASTTDASATDATTADADPTDTGADAATDAGTDASTGDAGGDSGTSDMADMADMADGGGPPPYDTTGWTMLRTTITESASVGTPDSYFFDVDSGSPLAASITGGGSGTWSVNVFGGMSNHLYCTGTASCQVMLRPEDTVVVVTAITTDIGSYTLTVDYAGDGPR